MKIKKIASIIFAVFALALAAAFGLFPFLEHKINWDYVAAKFATKAADAGCIDLAEKISNEVKFKPFLNKANAHIALYKLQDEGEKSAADFIKTCGKNFDFEEYNARRLIFDISNEPDFAAGLLKIKYESQINSLKNPFLKAVALYNMSLKSKPKDASTYANDAFKILKELPKSEDLTLTCIEISKLALDAKRPKDFFESLKHCQRTPHYYTALFKFLRDKKFREYSWKNNRYDWSFRAVEVRLEMFRKNPKPPIEMGKQMTYALTNSEYNGITGDYKYFNLPLVADIAFICEKEDLVNAYKNICISPETLKLMQGSKLGYLKNAAIFFTDTNDIDLALKLAGLSENKHQKLRILNSIAVQMPPESEFVEKFFRALISEK